MTAPDTDIRIVLIDEAAKAFPDRTRAQLETDFDRMEALTAENLACRGEIAPDKWSDLQELTYIFLLAPYKQNPS